MQRTTTTSHVTPSLDKFFDWQDYKTIKPSVTNLSATESKLNDNSAGELFYEIGTLYIHVLKTREHAQDKAIKCFENAAKSLTGKQLAWNKIQLAFAYQQKQMAAKNQGLTEQKNHFALRAKQLCAETIEQYQNSLENEHIKITGFALCVLALTQYEQGNITEATDTYRVALDLYEQHDLIDDQYARAKNRWAMMLAELGQIKEAKNAFEELNTYWDNHSDRKNIYIERFYQQYGLFIENKLPINQLPLAISQYKKAYAILKESEGENSRFTMTTHEKILSLEVKLRENSIYNSKMTSFKHPQETVSVDTQKTHKFEL